MGSRPRGCGCRDWDPGVLGSQDFRRVQSNDRKFDLNAGLPVFGSQVCLFCVGEMEIPAKH